MSRHGVVDLKILSHQKIESYHRTRDNHTRKSVNRNVIVTKRIIFLNEKSFFIEGTCRVPRKTVVCLKHREQTFVRPGRRERVRDKEPKKATVRQMLRLAKSRRRSSGYSIFRF